MNYEVVVTIGNSLIDPILDLYVRYAPEEEQPKDKPNEERKRFCHPLASDTQWYAVVLLEKDGEHELLLMEFTHQASLHDELEFFKEYLREEYPDPEWGIMGYTIRTTPWACSSVRRGGEWKIEPARTVLDGQYQIGGRSFAGGPGVFKWNWASRYNVKTEPALA